MQPLISVCCCSHTGCCATLPSIVMCRLNSSQLTLCGACCYGTAGEENACWSAPDTSVQMLKLTAMALYDLISRQDKQADLSNMACNAGVRVREV